jgi:hypothetical protein
LTTTADVLQRKIDHEITLEDAITESLIVYGNLPGMEETRTLLNRILFFSSEGYQPTPDSIAELEVAGLSRKPSLLPSGARSPLKTSRKASSAP